MVTFCDNYDEIAQVGKSFYEYLTNLSLLAKVLLRSLLSHVVKLIVRELDSSVGFEPTQPPSLATDLANKNQWPFSLQL